MLLDVGVAISAMALRDAAPMVQGAELVHVIVAVVMADGWQWLRGARAPELKA